MADGWRQVSVPASFLALAAARNHSGAPVVFAIPDNLGVTGRPR